MIETSSQWHNQFLRHIRSKSKHFKFKLNYNGTLPQWDDEAVHVAAYKKDPEFYALSALVEKVEPWQQIRILFQLLRTSRANVANSTSMLLEQISNLLMSTLHTDYVLKVFLALRRERANHKHTSRAIVSYLLNHPYFEDVFYKHKRIVADCFEHAIGKNTFRACAKMLLDLNGNKNYVQNHLLRFAKDKKRVVSLIPFLYSKEKMLPPEKTGYESAHMQTNLETSEGQLKKVTQTNRGDISATLFHIYRGGESAELLQALEKYVVAQASRFPVFSGKLAVVLDASHSTQSYGDREFCCISQSVALLKVIEKCCSDLWVYQVGGAGRLPLPQGDTDLAEALLYALELEPDIVAIISDGYENVCPGDLANVVASLPQAKIGTPVIFCHSKFGPADDLKLRRPATNLPELEFWHQDDFENLLLSLFSMAKGEETKGYLRNMLIKKLEKLEKEVDVWTARN